jgi:hypothetical protein
VEESEEAEAAVEAEPTKRKKTEPAPKKDLNTIMKDWITDDE